jgi:ATP-binding cassette subfamily E protein 1
MVKTGRETIIIEDETKKPVIVESMCSGCGICIKKCPYEAIKIINLPEETGAPVHQYGINGFRIYNLPTPRKGVVGMVGANGIGKTTIMKILSGELKPNICGEKDWDKIIERFQGNEIQKYLEMLSENRIKAVYKPQYVDSIPRYVKGDVKDILERGNENGKLDEIVEKLGMQNSMGKDIKELSGGELQKVAITASLIKDADMYLLDEPSSYLDVRERLRVAKIVREIEDKFVFVVEHDLVILDYLSDYIHIIYGSPGAYGIISNIKGVRVGINEYLGGFLKSENVQFREEIKFGIKPPREKTEVKEMISYPELKKRYDRFTLDVDSGRLYSPEIMGILGKNATGKTTFVKILAGVIKADNTELDLKLTVSYKPQYIKPTEELVMTLKLNPELVERFRIRWLMEKRMDELSGGELQKVAIADCLSKEADIYLLDEPSAYLDVEERLKLGKYLRKFADDREASVMVVDHDVLLIDYLSDELMVFGGESGKSGSASKPMSLKAGMNSFLKGMDVTFRRDPDSGRPRTNKPGSVKDREQRAKEEYYYVGQ